VPIGQFAIFLAQGEAGRHTRTIPAQIRRGETGAVVEKFRGVWAGPIGGMSFPAASLVISEGFRGVG
jgi:hypothetical protein